MERVKLDLQCPSCGFCKVMRIPVTQRGLKCPECGIKIFLRWATDVKGELDENGFYYHGYEPFEHDEKVRAFNAVFGM